MAQKAGRFALEIAVIRNLLSEYKKASECACLFDFLS